MAVTDIDTDKLMQFVFKAVDEVGATLNVALVVLGDKLGYYRDLAAHGPSTPGEMADRTQTVEPYAREWLRAQAAGGYLSYDPASGRFALRPEHAVALTVEDSPAYLPVFFQIALGTVHDTSAVIDAAQSAGGVSWVTTTPTYTSVASASSGRDTTRTWSRLGCLPSTVWCPSWRRVRGWRTSGAGMDRRPS
jgi:hypothetical protein